MRRGALEPGNVLDEISNEVIIRSNFVVPEPEESEVLKVFVQGISWPLKKNFKRTYGLKGSDGREENVTVGYILDPIPDELLSSIESKQKFFGMLPHSPDSPVLALVSLVTFDSVKGGTFDLKTMMDASEIDDIPGLDFIVMDGENFGEFLNSLDRIHRRSEGGQNPSARQMEPFEKLIFLERNRGLFTTHYCEEYFRLKLCDEGRIPKNTQHLAVRNQSLIYATPRLVASTGFKANLYKRNGKNPTGFWPPQLRRYGRNIYWSQYSGKELMRWKDSEGQDYNEATPVCDLKQHELSVRRIAASDATESDHLTIVANWRNTWKLLFFADVNTGSFVDLECPLRTIDSVAVMNDVIYAMGNRTDSLFPNIIIYYKDGRWSESINRIRNILPTAFFPMNGRLFLFANGLETIEVFDPQTERWTLNRIPPNMNDICGFTLFDAPARLPSEI